ncbi:MAG TPA: alpha-glucan family phosphorylase [Spirochaetia bacterium]|nr:alpha-glucan family phosphorylase [Spirochaetia bacterium]
MKLLTFTVQPNIPKPLKPLEELAHNMWISWNFDAVSLFIRLDYDAWMQCNQNPARLLGMVSQERFEEIAKDDSFLSALNTVYSKFQKYLNSDPWYKDPADQPAVTGSIDPSGGNSVIAYFSMEYGLDVSLPIYSGGLGMLSGDHLKSASDLGLPLVGVGLLYRQGYFKQYLNADGFQQESYPENDWYNMPVRQCKNKDGEPIKISLQMGEPTVTAQIWEVKIGRTSLLLLDTNIPENTEENRQITATLYGGNRETRIQQEILLGIGGIRALRAVGYMPIVTHMNEGHSAFLCFERIREMVSERKLTVSEAIQALWPTNIFTTHTPVPAGNERFGIDLMQKYFNSLTAGTNMSWEHFLALGREYPEDSQEPFCMTILALKLSAYSNGVSELHGDVSRKMWQAIWSGVPEQEIPITYITNGVHCRHWVSHDMVDLLDRYFGPRFAEDPIYLDIWNRMDRISDEELWRTHERRKERLVAFVRDRLRQQMEARGVTGGQLAHAGEVLSPYTLTVSFARRFATYKRATLLFRDSDRLKKLLTDPERPIQIIFAGKAHPHDMPGKNLIKDIVHFASQPEVRSKIVFLENYDIAMAKYLVSGSDLWLNTPRRPLEASGTSGMKAAINGVLNCSVLDGWWAEAYRPEVGWAIGSGEEYEDEEIQDEIETKALFDLLERDIVPTYYERGQDSLPREWIHRMKSSMHFIGKSFSSHRMLKEYTDMFYRPALDNAASFSKDDFQKARVTAAYIDRLTRSWPQVAISNISAEDVTSPTLKVGDKLSISATITLGELKPEDVAVELYFGTINNKGDFEGAERMQMAAVDANQQNAGNSPYRYALTVTCNSTGRQGYTVRVLPQHANLVHPFLPGFMKWGT